MSMVRRFVTAFMVSVALAASTGTAAYAATAPANATPTVTLTVHAAAPQVAAAPQAAPTFTCGAGIVATVCDTVLGPICRNKCLAAGSSQAATAAPATPRVSTLTGAATAPAATPTLYCAPEVQVVCDLLGLTICRHGCAMTPNAMATASSPSIYCEYDLVCYVLALTVCRHGCGLTAASTAATAIRNPLGDLCTINMRPNPFCMIPQ
jgi:hypothetical protein